MECRNAFALWASHGSARCGGRVGFGQPRKVVDSAKHLHVHKVSLFYMTICGNSFFRAPPFPCAAAG